MSNIHNSFWELFATFVNGIAFGALLFVGAVDVRLFLNLVSTLNADDLNHMIKTIFPQWWPFGRDLMAPVGVVGLILNILAYRSTKNNVWIIAATTQLLTIVWTGVIMGESISHLVNSAGENVGAIVQSFCYKHFPRVLFAMIGYVASLIALSSPKSQTTTDKNN